MERSGREVTLWLLVFQGRAGTCREVTPSVALNDL